MTVTIRVATTDDLPAMLAWRGHTPAMRAALEHEFALLEHGQRTIFVALEGTQMVDTVLIGTVIGTVQLVRGHADPELARDAAYLQALEVHAAYRRQGIARRLMDALETQARLEGLRRVTLMVEPENAPARALYERLRFHVFKTSTDTWDGQTYTVLCLEKKLI